MKQAASEVMFAARLMMVYRLAQSSTLMMVTIFLRNVG
jgi:hypothetical protein